MMLGTTNNKIFIQVWNFSPFQSTAPVPGYSDPCNVPTAGNCLKFSTEMLSRAASDSHWISAMLAKRLHFKTCFTRGHKKSRKERGQVSSRGVGHHHHFVFSQKLLDASPRSAYSVFKKIAKYTCRHFEEIPEKLTRSMQRIVTWQTSSEYRSLTVPSGRTLNYVSFVQRFKFRKYLGPSSYDDAVFSF